MAGGIFISYRREDSRHAAGRLVDRLRQTFGRDQLFMDVDAIEPGLDFVEVLSHKLDGCDVLLVLIGPGWLEARDRGGGRRLDNPSDFVRLEIETALRRNIRVIPVLLDEADLPDEASLPANLKQLARRQAVSIAHERFAGDAEGLVRALARIVEPDRRPASATAAQRAAPPSASATARAGLGHRLIAWAYALLALPAWLLILFPLSFPLMYVLSLAMPIAWNEPIAKSSVGVRIAIASVTSLPAFLVAAIGAYLRRSRGNVISNSELLLYWIGGTLTLACNFIFQVAASHFSFLGPGPGAALGSGALVAVPVVLVGLMLMIFDLRRLERVREAVGQLR